MAHAVARRTNEIGIRMALGARRGRIVWMVLRESLVLVFVGVLIGVPAALGAGRLIASQLFGLTSSDPISLVGAAIVLLAVAALAGLIPALKASRVDPMVALRYE
jgi:ABC-type antimicrobial peptide transport system permease subunit